MPKPTNLSLFHDSIYGITSPFIYVFLLLAFCIPFSWPYRYLLSGAPLLNTLLLLGALNQYRVLPFIPLWPLSSTLDLLYAICSTSWLFYYIFTLSCYLSIPIICLCQFPFASNLFRRRLRKLLLHEVQFLEDRIACFGIPGLEIDTDVDGMVAVRGVENTVSALRIRVHGVEVGIKLKTDGQMEGKPPMDVEVGIKCEEVVIRLFMGVDIGDCYICVKGGDGEISMKIEEEVEPAKPKTENEIGTPLLQVDSKMMRAVTNNMPTQAPKSRIKKSQLKVDSMVSGPSNAAQMRENSNEKQQQLPDSAVALTFDHQSTQLSNVKEAMKSVTRISPDENTEAHENYSSTIKHIHTSNSIQQCRAQVLEQTKSLPDDKLSSSLGTHTSDYTVVESENDIRASICSLLHAYPSIAHPPTRAIKVSTIKTLLPPHIRSYLHRLPMLLRLLLCPLAYFHPVNIASVTITCSGRFVQRLLKNLLFSPTTPASPVNGNRDVDEEEDSIPKIQARVQEWLVDANFVLELGSTMGNAQVPFFTGGEGAGAANIRCHLAFGDVVAYRTVLSPSSSIPSILPNAPPVIEQVIRLGGADASFSIPLYLLPHHEHLLPSLPSEEEVQNLEQRITDAEARSATEGNPKDLEMLYQLKQRVRDCCDVEFGFHARLPAVFDQELLDWVAVLVKASKIMEMEKEPNAMDNEVHGLRDFMGAVGGGMKASIKKNVLATITRDKWIAKMVGKVTKKLEEGRGDAGYTGGIPVPLGNYRLSE